MLRTQWLMLESLNSPTVNLQETCPDLPSFFYLTFTSSAFSKSIHYPRAWQRFLVVLKKAPHTHIQHQLRDFFSKPSQLCASQECKHLHFTRGIAIMIQNTPHQCVQIQPINTQWENMACDCLCSLNPNGWIILPPLKAADTNTGLTLYIFNAVIRVSWGSLSIFLCAYYIFLK